MLTTHFAQNLLIFSQSLVIILCLISAPFMFLSFVSFVTESLDDLKKEFNKANFLTGATTATKKFFNFLKIAILPVILIALPFFYPLTGAFHIFIGLPAIFLIENFYEKNKFTFLNLIAFFIFSRYTELRLFYILGLVLVCLLQETYFLIADLLFLENNFLALNEENKNMVFMMKGNHKNSGTVSSKNLTGMPWPKQSSLTTKDLNSLAEQYSNFKRETLAQVRALPPFLGKDIKGLPFIYTCSSIARAMVCASPEGVLEIKKIEQDSVINKLNNAPAVLNNKPHLEKLFSYLARTNLTTEKEIAPLEKTRVAQDLSKDRTIIPYSKYMPYVSEEHVKGMLADDLILIKAVKEESLANKQDPCRIQNEVYCKKASAGLHDKEELPRGTTALRCEKHHNPEKGNFIGSAALRTCEVRLLAMEPELIRYPIEIKDGPDFLNPITGEKYYCKDSYHITSEIIKQTEHLDNETLRHYFEFVDQKYGNEREKPKGPWSDILAHKKELLKDPKLREESVFTINITETKQIYGRAYESDEELVSAIQKKAPPTVKTLVNNGLKIQFQLANSNSEIITVNAKKNGTNE